MRHETLSRKQEVLYSQVMENFVFYLSTLDK